MIQKIIADETWLEGERRGCCVSPEDPVVRENVCLIILRIGAEMRAAILARCEAAMGTSAEPMPAVRSSDHHAHAA